MSRKRPRVLPGFPLSLGYTLFWLGLIVLLPLSAALAKTAGMSLHEFGAAVSTPRVLASYRLSFGAALIAAFINVWAGLWVAWVLVRYRFPGRKCASSAESVGELRLWKCPKIMIESDFQRRKSA
jgi:sulfate transport system permease protein